MAQCRLLRRREFLRQCCQQSHRAAHRSSNNASVKPPYAPPPPHRRERRLREEATYEVAPVARRRPRGRAAAAEAAAAPGEASPAEARPVLRENAPRRSRPRNCHGAAAPRRRRGPDAQWDVDPDDEDEIQREREGRAPRLEASQAKARTATSGHGVRGRRPERQHGRHDAGAAGAAARPVPAHGDCRRRRRLGRRPVMRRGGSSRTPGRKTTTFGAGREPAASANRKRADNPGQAELLDLQPRPSPTRPSSRRAYRQIRRDARSINSALLAQCKTVWKSTSELDYGDNIASMAGARNLSSTQSKGRARRRPRPPESTRLPQTMEVLATILTR